MNTYLPLAVIRSLGISATHLGYYYLNTSILLILEDENRLLMVSKLLYPPGSGNPQYDSILC